MQKVGTSIPPPTEKDETPRHRQSIPHCGGFCCCTVPDANKRGCSKLLCPMLVETSQVPREGLLTVRSAGGCLQELPVRRNYPKIFSPLARIFPKPMVVSDNLASLCGNIPAYPIPIYRSRGLEIPVFSRSPSLCLSMDSR